MFTGEKLFKDLTLYRTSYGRLPEEAFVGSYSLNEIIKLAKEPPHTSHSYLQRVEYYKKPMDYEDLKALFETLPKHVIRAKGIVRLRHTPYPVIVNYSFGSFYLGEEVPHYKDDGFIVFISKNSIRLF
ncbi:GTP-binding protein [Thermocrinis sp.]